MADTAYERVLCVKNEVLVYRIPPRPSNRGYRADEWKLENPEWTGRLRVVSKGKDLLIKLEDKNNGELFAQCPVDSYPGIAIEPVMDSSRYFVIRIKDDSGRSAFIGIGFHDRADSFDLNVSIQDHFKWLKQEAEEEKIAKTVDVGPKLDLGFKEGQTITLNLGTKKGDGSKSRKTTTGASGLGLLPPPPGGLKLPPPSSTSSTASSGSSQPNTFQASPAQSLDLLLDIGSSEPVASGQKPLVTQNPPDLWGDFASASGSQSMSSNNSGGDWVQF
ncbi:adaptin ear-binding coat-associated protein 1-like [Physella acuta]|uniref:adaptin ear-binding coat-associated protein 1-like n=1 Tax=Physella acuta TaxID=109671 RepID=UPI0027DE0D3C|nr:adaptin ear-binding coat-associated protein 1-like [Physella acuta]